MRYDTITFLTDYGTSDESVGLVKSVIRSIAPRVAVIDLSHDIPAFDVRAASLMLARSVPYLVPGVVLAVVDPTVGTERRCLAVEVGDGESVLVGPDNGLLAPAVALAGGATRVVELVSDDFRMSQPSATFAGRDIFGPAAAHLCCGIELTELGPELDASTLVPATLPFAELRNDTVSGDVIHVDRYGNLHLNVSPDQIDEFGESVAATLSGETFSVVRRRTYAEVKEGELMLLLDEFGMIELAANKGSAAERCSASVGSTIELRSGR